MSETVVRNGVTLHAPMLACRPVRFEDWPAERRELQRRLEAETGVRQVIYPGSTYAPCEDCGIEVAVGPRQQTAAAMADELGLAVHVLCTFDAAERTSGKDDAAAVHLGNPFRRAES